MTNPNCDHEKCASETGEVRVLPLTKDPHHGNLILCRACYAYELGWRIMRNKELSKEAQYALPAWESLKVYENKP